MKKTRKRNNCSISKDSFIFYRKNAEWFLSTIEELWNTAIGNVESKGACEIKSLKDKCYAISFEVRSYD